MSASTTPTQEKNDAASPSVEEESHKVFVGNLSFSTTKDALKNFFDSAGTIVDTIVVKQKSRSKGFGFVAFATLAEAQKAIETLDKKELDGREISVQLAKTREPKQQNPEKKKKKTNRKARKSVESKEQKETDDEKKDEKKDDKKDEKLPIDPISSVEVSKENIAEELKPKTTVFVANLPRNYKVKQLTELFKDYDVESALVAIKGNGASKGYGFVELKTVEEMKRVLTEFVDVEVGDRVIHVSAATSEKSSTRRPKNNSNNKKPNSPTPTSETEDEKSSKPIKKRSRRHRRPSNKKKVNEGVEAASEAQEAVKELKKEDGVEAAKEAQNAVKELKKEDGVEAAKEAQNAVKELKKEDGVEAAKEAQEAVKELKKEDGVEAAKEAKEAVKELKKEDGVEAAKEAKEAVKELKKEDGAKAAASANKETAKK